MATPASYASSVDQVDFKVASTAVVQAVSRSQGVQKFLVASNAPFTVMSKGSIGEISVEIKTQGQIGGRHFGSAAQMPGRKKSCTVVTSALKSAIYNGARKTASRPGHLMQQAVMVIVRHDKNASPVIKIKTEHTPHSALKATQCKIP